MKSIEFQARFKKVNWFNETMHMIVFPEGGLRMMNELLDIEEGQKIKVFISVSA